MNEYKGLLILDIDGTLFRWSLFLYMVERLVEAGLFSKVTRQYFYVEEQDIFAHPAVVFLLTEQGVISRYLYGLEYNPRDLRLGLLEAAEGKIGSTIDRLILFCYHYDPEEKGYVLFATNLMRLGGILTVILLVIFLGLLWARERLR